MKEDVIKNDKSKKPRKGWSAFFLVAAILFSKINENIIILLTKKCQ